MFVRSKSGQVTTTSGDVVDVGDAVLSVHKRDQRSKSSNCDRRTVGYFVHLREGQTGYLPIDDAAVAWAPGRKPAASGKVKRQVHTISVYMSRRHRDWLRSRQSPSKVVARLIDDYKGRGESPPCGLKVDGPERLLQRLRLSSEHYDWLAGPSTRSAAIRRLIDDEVERG